MARSRDDGSIHPDDRRGVRWLPAPPVSAMSRCTSSTARRVDAGLSLRDSRLAALTRIREARGHARAQPRHADRPVAARLAPLLAGDARRGRDAVRDRQRLHGHPRRARRGPAVQRPGFFLNGFHETWPIPYGEAAFGFATTGQTIVSAPDGSVMRLYVDEEPLVLAESKLLQYERVLDMRSRHPRAHRSLPYRARRGRRSCARSGSRRCTGAIWRRSPTRSRSSPGWRSWRSPRSSSRTCRGRRATTTRASACGWTSRRSRRSTSSATTRACCWSCARARARSGWRAAWSTASRPSCATTSSPACRRTRGASCSSSTPCRACRRGSRSCSAITTPTRRRPATSCGA